MSKLEKIPLVKELEKTPVTHIANIPQVGDNFKRLYKVMQGGDPDRAVVKYEAEKFHFSKLLADKPELQKCTKLSLYGAFMDMAVNGLSFDPAMNHAYLYTRNVKVSPKGQPDKWETRAVVHITAQGELLMRMKQKQIKYADNPVLVYVGDRFVHGTRQGKVFLEHEAKFPRESEEIIACYIRIERLDGSVDYKVLGIGEVMRLREFSKDPNSLAWTKGLPGMIQTKTTRHAFRGYPKLKMGEFSEQATDKIEEDDEATLQVDYGIPTDHQIEEAPEAEPEKPITVHDEYTLAKKPEVHKDSPAQKKAANPEPPPADDDFVQDANSGEFIEVQDDNF